MAEDDGTRPERPAQDQGTKPDVVPAPPDRSRRTLPSDRSRRLQTETWLRDADSFMVQLRRQLAAEHVPERRAALQGRIAELRDDIAHYEDRWVRQQASSTTDADDLQVAYHYMRLAAAHADADNYELSVASYDRAIASNATPPVAAYVERAETYAQLGRWREALDDFERAERLSGGHGNDRIVKGKAIAHYHLDELDQATAEFERLSTSPSAGDDARVLALSYLAAIATLRQHREDALRYFDLALALGTQATDSANLARLYYNRAALLQDMGNAAAALDSYEQARALDPTNADVYQGPSRIYRNQGDLEQAEQSLREALERQPERPDFLVDLGTLLVRRRNFQKARQAYERALELGWSVANVYDGLGTCALAQGDLDGAAASFRRAIKIQPDSAASWGNLGAVLFHQGNLDAAWNAYRNAMDAPDNGPVEAAWYAALSYLHGQPVDTDVVAPLDAGVKRNEYELAEYEGARLVARALAGEGEAALRTVERNLQSESDPLALFYWQTCRQALAALVQRDMDYR